MTQIEPATLGNRPEFLSNRGTAMTVLYQDSSLVCHDDYLIIYWYYFPLGDKCIPYSKIRSIQEERLNFFNGAGRIWGMGFTPEWYPFDPQRPWKTKRIIIDDGEGIKTVITPENPERVLEILSQQNLQ